MKLRKRGFLICFMGIDGSGKTTLARILLSILKSEAINAKYVWGAYDVILLRPLISLLKIRSNGRKKVLPDGARFQNSMRRNPIRGVIGSLYKSLVLLEYQFEIFFKINFPLMLGTNIVCDRYVSDTVINLAVNVGYSQDEFKQLFRMVMSRCPKPNLVFFVDVPEEVAYSRKNDIPSLKYLKKRRQLYTILAKENDATNLNGLASLSDLRLDIQNSLKETWLTKTENT